VITLEDILNIICTEAFEHSGIPEVPDHRYGSPPNYAYAKRDARGQFHIYWRSNSRQLPKLDYDVELIVDDDGNLHWVD
jgi:hypothetical protein